MFYIEEEKRGFFPEEDLFIPGRYEIEIKPEETKEFTKLSEAITKSLIFSCSAFVFFSSTNSLLSMIF